MEAQRYVLDLTIGKGSTSDVYRARVAPPPEPSAAQAEPQFVAVKLPSTQIEERNTIGTNFTTLVRTRSTEEI